MRGAVRTALVILAQNAPLTQSLVALFQRYDLIYAFFDSTRTASIEFDEFRTNSTNFALILSISQFLYILRILLQIQSEILLQLTQKSLAILSIVMDSTNSSNRPSTPPPPAVNDTTRDQRLQIQTLHDVGLSYTQIQKQLGLTLRQIQYAARHRITPKKRAGRPSTLTQEEVNEIINWVCALKANRRAPWAKIPIILDLNVS